MKKLDVSKTYLNSGQALSEYLILSALIAVASIGLIQTVSVNLRAKLAQVAAALRGEKKEYKGQAVESRHLKTYDLGDFNEGMSDSRESDF